MRDSRTSLLVVIFLIIVAAAVADYFVWFLPSENLREDLAVSQTECSQLQNSAIENYKQSGVGASANDIITATNHYNRELHKCIVEITDLSLGGGTPSTGVTIVDGLENAELAYCLFTVDETNPLHPVQTANCLKEGSNASTTPITENAFNQLEKDYLNN